MKWLISPPKKRLGVRACNPNPAYTPKLVPATLAHATNVNDSLGICTRSLHEGRTGHAKSNAPIVDQPAVIFSACGGDSSRATVNNNHKPRFLLRTQAMRRAWNLPDKRAVLSSVANLMVCGTADFHPDFEGRLSRVSSSTPTGNANTGKGASKRGNGRSRYRAEGERCDRHVATVANDNKRA